MSMLLRSLMVASVAGLLMVGCGEKPAEAPVDVAPATPAATATPAPAPAAEAAPAPAGGGGYEPTAEERVPGITMDAAAPAAEAPTAPAGTEPPPAPEKK